MSTRCVALLRGINVGTAKRVSMAELRTVAESLGFTDVATLLNSGNVTFTAPARTAKTAAAALERAIESKFGFQVSVIVLTALELDAVIAENPFTAEAREPSRLLVAFVGDTSALPRLRPLAEADHGANRLALGARAAYLWCPDGISQTTLPDEATRALKGTVVTTRNWTTTLKLQERLHDA